MNIENEKLKKGIYLEAYLWEQAEELMEIANARSRNEFVSQAMKFYIGYLTSKKVENYMLKTISSMMISSVHDSENRMARAFFKLAVEISKLSNVIAYTHGVDNDAMNKLQAKCVDEVKRINGSVKFEDAYDYQNENK